MNLAKPRKREDENTLTMNNFTLGENHIQDKLQDSPPMRKSRYQKCLPVEDRVAMANQM